ITVFFFFFQAEDGIRDFHVTGVQTCALPISHDRASASAEALSARAAWDARHCSECAHVVAEVHQDVHMRGSPYGLNGEGIQSSRSEERRVGKECRARGSA